VTDRVTNAEAAAAVEASSLSPHVKEAVLDALVFTASLHEALKASGAPLGNHPDVDELGSVIDSMFGEISAACLFLSENVFARVPEMLRKTATSLAKMDTVFTDPSGTAGPSVPAVVVAGFHSLASRIEATRTSKAALLNALKRAQETNGV
jgi:hypothetical protein